MSPVTRYIFSLLATGVLGCLAAKPDLYYFPPSPPCRIVMMTAKVLGTDINLKLLDISKKEQLTPEFLKINPQHTIPTLDDNGFILSESRAIQAYLADTNPSGEKIYPKDPKKRALVEEMLYFDIGRLYQNFLDLYKPMIMGKPMDEDRKNTMNEALAMLEEYLTRRQWVSGDMMTIADLSVLSTVSTLETSFNAVKPFSYLSETVFLRLSAQSELGLLKKIPSNFTLQVYSVFDMKPLLRTLFAQIGLTGMQTICSRVITLWPYLHTATMIVYLMPYVTRYGIALFRIAGFEIIAGRSFGTPEGLITIYNSRILQSKAVGHDLSKFPKINAWLAKSKAAVPDYQSANQDGVNHWKEMFEMIMKKTQ